MGQPRRTARVRPVALVALTAVLSGCGLIGDGASAAQPLDSVNVSSRAFKDGAPLPKEYACDGTGNPPLRWSGIPRTAKSIALVVDSTSADRAEVLWVVFDIDPRTTELVEGSVPQGARQGRTTNGKVGYQPPCRAEDSYRFSVYALSSELDLAEGAPLSETLTAIASRTVARGRLTATRIE